jgi:hypothetical protein
LSLFDKERTRRIQIRVSSIAEAVEETLRPD